MNEHQAVPRTVFDLLAERPAVVSPGPQPLRSTPTQQRTFDQVNNRPDSQPDISQE